LRTPSLARVFLREASTLSGQGHIECARVYGDYRLSSDVNGYRPLNERDFGKEVKREFASIGTSGVHWC
jgi:hypothetical protein